MSTFQMVVAIPSFVLQQTAVVLTTWDWGWTFHIRVALGIDLVETEFVRGSRSPFGGPRVIFEARVGRFVRCLHNSAIGVNTRKQEAPVGSLPRLILSHLFKTGRIRVNASSGFIYCLLQFRLDLTTPLFVWSQPDSDIGPALILVLKLRSRAHPSIISKSLRGPSSHVGLLTSSSSPSRYYPTLPSPSTSGAFDMLSLAFALPLFVSPSHSSSGHRPQGSVSLHLSTLTS